MPFAGELVQARDSDTAWEGVAKRLLHNFALSLLVPDHPYPQVAQWAERTLAHELLWGCESKPTRKLLPRLNAKEQALYEDLFRDRLAPSVRLEEERIRFVHLHETLRIV